MEFSFLAGNVCNSSERNLLRLLMEHKFTECMNNDQLFTFNNQYRMFGTNVGEVMTGQQVAK